MRAEDARTAARDGTSTRRVCTFVSPGETLATISEETKQATSNPSILSVPASSELLPNPHRGRVKERSRCTWDKFSNKMMSYACCYIIMHDIITLPYAWEAFLRRHG